MASLTCFPSKKTSMDWSGLGPFRGSSTGNRVFFFDPNIEVPWKFSLEPTSGNAAPSQSAAPFPGRHAGRDHQTRGRLAYNYVYIWCLCWQKLGFMFDVSWYNDIPVSKACGSVKKHVYTQIWSNLPTSVSFNIMEGMTYYIYIYIMIYYNDL